MDIHKVSEIVTSPKTQVTCTAFFCWIGVYTKEELLTDLSILAVVIQIVVSLPKLIDLIREYVVKLKAKF